MACGEAPYLVSRYDTTTGENIPVKNRVGHLNRKLRIVNENTKTKEDWMKWIRKNAEKKFAFPGAFQDKFLTLVE